MFDVESLVEDAPNSPCYIMQCDNPHTTKMCVDLESNKGELLLCDACVEKHKHNRIIYFFFEDELGMDIKICYFEEDEFYEFCDDSIWEVVAERFFSGELYKYRKEPENGN